MTITSIVLASVVGQALVVAIDPGHGTRTNSGAVTVRCQDEATVNLDVAEDLAHDLRIEGFKVHLLRRSNDGPSYKRRIARAKRLGAHVLLSIHGDARGMAQGWQPTSRSTCPRNDAEPGFAILYSEDGAASAVARRKRLARAIATNMNKADFVPYSGFVYGSLYSADEVPGVFKDRRGLFMLRRPAMPSVIIETHHLWNLREHDAWAAPARRKAFARTIATALRSANRPER